MDPGQHDVGSHVANDVRVVGVEGNICISRPAVGLGGTGRSDVLRDELVEAVAAVVGDAVEAQPARVLPSPTSMLPTTSILPSWLRLAPLAGGPSWCGRATRFRRSRPGPITDCGWGRPSPGAAWQRASRRCGKSRARVVSAVEVRTCRSNELPSDRLPRTRSSDRACCHGGWFPQSPRFDDGTWCIRRCVPCRVAPSTDRVRSRDIRRRLASAPTPARRRMPPRRETSFGRRSSCRENGP